MLDAVIYVFPLKVWRLPGVEKHETLNPNLGYELRDLSLIIPAYPLQTRYASRYIP